MSFFKKFYLPPVQFKENDDQVFPENGTTKNGFSRIFLSPDLSTNPSSVSEYVCKICHSMAVDPLEHIPGPNVTCTNIFCLPCVKQHCESGLSSCPAEGCLTTGFNESSLRELGHREIARLSNLTLNCEFKCEKVITYRDYWTHREICPANPANFCTICESPKTDAAHDCRTAFIELKKRDASLTKENIQLKVEIDKLRRELDLLRVERAEKIINRNGSHNDDDSLSISSLPDSQISKDSNSSTIHSEKHCKPPRKPKEKSNNSTESFSHKPSSSFSKPTQNNEVDKEAGFLRGPLPQYKFHSNIYKIKPDHNRVRLMFHYGEKSYAFNDVQPTFTFRTLRSLLTDMIKFDPGIMLLVKHRTLHDRETIASCGFKPGSNSVSLVPYETPDYNEPGFRLSLYRIKDARDPLDARSSPLKPNKPNEFGKETINFYSNNLNPQIGEKDISLVFRLNGRSYSVDRVNRNQTVGEIRTMVRVIIDRDPGKMMYITHQLLKDDMTIQQCGLTSGTIDITLLPPTFPVDLEKTRTLNMFRYKNDKIGKKFPNKLKSRASSMASLV